MPVDHRRFTGPDGSVDYKVYRKNKPPSSVDPHNRPDKRATDESRKLFLHTGIISQAKGSAYVEQGSTKVMVGVYGPREVPKRSDFSMKGSISCEFKFAPFSCYTRRAHQADKEELELGLLLKECLESTVRMNLYPKSCIDVFVTIIEDGGGCLAAALTASGLALSDAQIALYDNIIGTNVRLSQGEMVVDPSEAEEFVPGVGGNGEGNLTIGYLNTMEQVVCLVSQGHFSQTDLQKALEVSVHQAGIILPAVHQCQIEALKSKKKREAQP